MSDTKESLANNNTSTNTNNDMKAVTCSLTRANKILTKMRNASDNDTFVPQIKYKRRKYMSGLDDSVNPCGVTVKLLTFNQDETKNALESFREALDKKLTRKQLIEKMKNRLFELNVHYGIHEILSEIDNLNIEKRELLDILNQYNSSTKKYTSYSNALASIESVKSYDKKYELEWHIAAFDSDELKERLKVIDKCLSSLDDKKDRLNIEKSFTIKLSPLEYEMCGF